MVYNLSFPILGGIYDVDELDNESQEHQHRKYDDHMVRQMERGLGDAIERTAFPGDSRFFRKTGVSLNHTPENRDKNLNYMLKGHTTGMTTRQMMRERMHMGMPTFA